MRQLLKYNLLFGYLAKVNGFPMPCALGQSFRKYSSDRQNKSTINEEELNKFRTIKANDWMNDPMFVGLRQMNELRVPLIRDAFNPSADTSTPLKGIKLLDIGCGPGILAEPLARLGAHVTGIDPVQENIDKAVDHKKNDKEVADNLNYECTTIEELSAKEGMKEHFDGVIASEVVEHVDNVDMFLSSSLKCLKKGGHLFITTINQTPVALFAAIFVAEYVLNILPKGTHQYNKFVSPQALSLVLQDRK